MRADGGLFRITADINAEAGELCRALPADSGRFQTLVMALVERRCTDYWNFPAPP
jgi:hypothetical protein